MSHHHWHGGETLDRLRALPDAIGSGLASAIAKLGVDLQRKVQQEKLSGQILINRSGALQSSIDLRLDQSAGTATATVYTDSKYARAQEYGFSGTVNVMASIRRIRQAFGRPIGEKTISVRAHSRRMDLAEHSFLRSALEDMTPEIRNEVEAALRAAVAK
jgi:hypothetical protein